MQTEQRLVDREGRTIWVLLNTSLVRDDDGSPSHRIVQLQDVSEHKRFERQLQHLADHDALTGLFNRRRFEEELNRELATAARYGRGGAVLAIDLDNFKFVNDSLGHSAGDELITRVGGLLTDRLRDTDIVARLSGDEFAIVLPQADRARALAVADELLETIRMGAVVAGGPIPTGDHRQRGHRPVRRRRPGGDRRGAAGRGRHGDVRRQGGRPRSPRAVRRGRPRGPHGGSAHLGRPDPRGARGGSLHAGGPADREPDRRPAARATSCCCGWSARTAT